MIFPEDCKMKKIIKMSFYKCVNKLGFLLERKCNNVRITIFSLMSVLHKFSPFLAYLRIFSLKRDKEHIMNAFSMHPENNHKN